MKHKRRNNFGLSLFVTLLAVLGIMLMMNNGPWTDKTANAAISLSAETQANFTTRPLQKTSATAVDGKGNLIVVWAANNGTDDDIYFRRFDSQGNAIDSSDIQVNTSTAGNQSTPVIAADVYGNFIIAWSGNGTQSGQTDSQGVFIQAYRSSGGAVTPVGGEIRVNTTTTNSQTAPSIAMDTYDATPNAVKFAVAYTSDQTTAFNVDIYAQRFTVNLTQTVSPPSLAGSETLINTTTSGNQINPSVAMNLDGTFAVSWYGDGPTGSSRVWYRAYAADGTALDAGETQVNTQSATWGTSIAASQKSISASTSFGDTTTFIIAWQGLFSYGAGTNDSAAARIVTCTDPAPGNASDTDLTCSMTSPELIATDDIIGSEWNPRVAADGFGNFTVIWDDELTNHDILGQSFTFRGKRIGSNFTVNTVTTGTQVDPSIGMNRDGFYNISYTNNNTNNEYFHNYVNETSKVQTEVLAHAASGNYQATAATDIGENGNHVEVWKDYTDDTIRFSLRSYDNDATPIQQNVRVSAIGSVNNGNPSVSFFADTTGAGAGRFIVMWESDTTGDKDIYYQIYDAAGAPDGTTQRLNSSTTGNQTTPDVSAGCYMTTCDDSGTANRIFAATYVDENTNSIESAFNNAGITYDTLKTCSGVTCKTPRVSLYPYTTPLRAAYVWPEKELAGENEFGYVTKTVDGVQDGSVVAISGGETGTSHARPDIAMSAYGDFIIVYSRDPGSEGVIVGQKWNFNTTGLNPSSAENVHKISDYVSGSGDYVYPKIENDINNGYALVVWTDLPITTGENNIYATFLEGSTAIGNTFRVNSTQSSDQTLPSVGLNSSGQAVAAWEGNVNQPSNIDTNGIATQLLWNPFTLAAPTDLMPTAQQEIQAGGQFLYVPTNIVFPPAPVDTQNAVTQSVSIRDVTYGGDTLKYIQIEDATGVDFTLTIQASDFYAASDGRPYITAAQHFRVRNWDQDGTGTEANCTGGRFADPSNCFTKIYSSYPTTAFSLGVETETFTFINTQKVLAEKTGTTENEIGQWRIYPEFEITVPPLIPPGVHEATITFTLT